MHAGQNRKRTQAAKGQGDAPKPLLLSAGLMLLMAAALVGYYFLTLEQAVASTGEILRGSAKEQVETLGAIVDGQYETLELLARGIASEEPFTTENAVRQLSASISETAFLHLFYTLPNGTAHDETGSALDIADRAYFQQAISGKRSIERVSAGKRAGELRIILAVPIERDGRIVGVLHGSYSEQILRERIIPNVYEGEAYSAICNEDGDYVAGSDNPNSILAETNVFSTLSEVKLASGVTVEQIRADVQNGESGMFSYTLDGEKRYAVYMPLDIVSAAGKRWFILNVLQGGVVDRAVRAQSGQSAALLLVVVTAALGSLLLFVLRERRNAEQIRAERDRLRISEEQFRIAAAKGERSVARYDIAAGVYHNDSGELFAKGLPKEILNVPEAFIEAGLVAPDSVAETRAYFDKVRSGEKNCSATVALRTPGGEYRWFQSDATVVSGEDGTPMQAIIVYCDITEQREKEAVYRKWQQSLQARPQEDYTLFRCNLSKSASFDSVEGALLQIHFSPEAATFNARTLEYAEQFVCQDDREAYIRLLDSDSLLADYYRGRRTAELVYRERMPEDAVRWLRISVEMVEYPDSKDIEVYLMYENIDESKRAEIAAKERADADPLTGVLHRIAFEEKFEQMIRTSAPGIQHALLMLDVDGFKQLNDNFGHAAGDQALREVTEALRSVLRRDDYLGRAGGDEFVVCLRDVPYDAAIEKKAMQICALVRKVWSVGTRLSVSVGAAVYPRDGEDFGVLYRNADIAMYDIKGSGKDGFAFYNATTGGTRTAVQRDKADETGDAGARAASRMEPKRRMLIVDDNELNRKLLARIFQEEYLIDTAGDGRTALIRLRHCGAGVSVVLLDLAMPGLDGYDVLREMHESPELRTIPVVVVSAAEEREALLKTIQAGATDYVTKPVDPELVRLRVHSAVSKAENERLRAQNSYLQLQSSEEIKYRTVLESTGTVVIEYNWLSGQFTYDSSVSEYIAGHFDGRKLWQIFLSDMVASTLDVRAMQELVHGIADDRTRSLGQLTVLLRTPRREKHWFQMNVFKRADEYQLTEKMILTFRDVNDEVLADEKLRFQAERDELTGLYNRGTFLRKAEEEVRAKPANTFIMCVGDIDHFKIINDRFGHVAGDNLLRHVAETLLSDTERVRGLCGRLSGDVFAMLLPFSPGVLQRINRYPQRFLADYPLDLKVTCSIGLYRIDNPELSADGMLDRAALAKATIKDKYDSNLAWYDEDMRSDLLMEQEITDSMETALSAGQFDVYLQPQYDHLSGKICGAEALVRWINPEKGLIPPAAFIPIFERNGFITKLDEYVWDRTAAHLHAWLASGHAVVPVSVNVSRMDTGDPMFCQKLMDIVRRHEIPIELFRLEITESLFVENAERLITVVDELHKNGFLIEMDDFGSGYSSLNILKDVPVDILKLDMRFFSETGDRARGGAILNAVMRMARALNMPAIAEGVETRAQADFLGSIGCRIIQGYLYARPMPVADFERLLGQSQVAPAAGAAQQGAVTAVSPFWDPDSADSERFNDAMGAAAIYEYDMGTFETLRVNRHFLEAMQLPVDGILPLRGLSMIHPDDLPLFHAAARQAMQSGAEETLTARRVFPDGRAPLSLCCSLHVMERQGEGRAVILCTFAALGEEQTVSI